MEDDSHREIQDALIKTALDIKKRIVQLEKEGKTNHEVISILEHGDFRQFCIMFPLVLNYMVFLHLFDPGFFRYFLKIIQTKQKGDEHEMMELQIDYLIRLRRKYYKETPQQLTEIRSQMSKEMEELQKKKYENEETMKNKSDEQKKELLKLMREELENEAKSLPR